MSDKGVIATDALRQAIAGMSPEQHDQVLRMVEARTAYLGHMYSLGEPKEFVKAFYEAFDECLAEVKERDKNPISCRKGCYFCCGQSVTIWAAEAELIAEWCKEHGIDIAKAYLREQLKYDWKELALQEARWCVFLKAGECSIYPVRPLCCRKYHVASAPELCDTVKYPSSKGYKVAICVYTLPEIEASAFTAALSKKGKGGRMPEMLLPYSK